MDDLGENREHLWRACAEARPGDVLVDLGVRDGCSSRIMLQSTENQKSRVIGVDLFDTSLVAPRYTFLKTDSITAAMMIDAPLFLVFVDTLHIKEQVMAEMFHYWPKIRVGGYACFHDTNWPKDKHDWYCGQYWDHPIAGIKTFFDIDSYIMGHFVLTKHFQMHHYPESWGMTIIQKLDEWNPVVPGMERALQDSKMLTEAYRDY